VVLVVLALLQAYLAHLLHTLVAVVVELITEHQAQEVLEVAVKPIHLAQKAVMELLI
jgi:hypothetical protein